MIKRIETIAVAMFFAHFACSGQVKHTNGPDSLKKVNRRTPRIVTFTQMDQRKIYHWDNGQQSTATGREAGENTSNYVELIGDDSAVVVPGPEVKK